MKKILCMTGFLSAFLPASAFAQMIDYASLEALFGESVTTSTTGAPQRVPDAPVPIHIITAEDIRRSGATDLPDVLRGVPGISVWRFTRDDAEVSARGYNQPFSSRLLVLVNGRQVYMDDYGYAVWSAIPVQLNEIRQIEVVRGPNAALFGFNALAGVVNIVTYNPAYDDVSSLDVTVGTDKYRNASGVHSMKFNDSFSARVSGRLGRADEFKSTNRTNFDDVQQKAVNIDSVYNFDEDSSLRVEISHAFNDRAEPTPQYSTFFSLYRVNAIKAAYSASTDFGMITVNAYHNAWNKALNPLTGTISNGLTVIQAEDVFRVGANHRFRVQGEYRNNTIESDAYFGENAELDSRNMALSGMWDWTIFPTLVWTNAARAEKMSFERTGDLLGAPYPSNDLFDKSFMEYSYNSGLVWSVTEKDTLRFMTGRGIQAPTLVEFGLYLDAGAINFAGNPEIEPTAMTSYEIGYDRAIEQTGGSAFANIFFQQTQDLKYLGNRNISGTFVGDNIGRSNTYGFELGMDGKVGENWIWDTNYMYQDVDDNLHAGEATDYNGEDGTPKHTVNAHIGYAKDKWEADLYANFVSRYDMNTSVTSSTDEIGSGSALSLSGRVGYALSDNMTLSLSGQELNHQSTKQTSIFKAERRIFLGLKAEF